MDNKTKEFIDKAIKKHGNKYNYSKVVYINSQTKVIIICLIHGEFFQRPNDHFALKGCKKCAIIQCHNKLKKTNEEFINEAKKIHGDIYDYSEVEYKNYDTEVIIICKIHGKYLQTPDKHLRNSGCKQCSFDKAHLKFKSNNEEFIQKAKNIHGDKYDYSLVNYYNARTNIIIICLQHGKFNQLPYNHLIGQGCPKCGLETIIKKSNRMTNEEFIKKAIEIHGEKYDYSKVIYKNYKQKS